MKSTEFSITTDTKLERIAELSSRDRSAKFDCVMHHFNETSLEECYYRLDGQKAVGADGVSKSEYGEKLNVRLKDLVTRMKRMGYRPRAVREVLIPKEGKPNATRALGISNFEDKVVQLMMHRILESIYEPLFLDCSYGFRPNRGCHDAIKAVHQHLYSHSVQKVLDVDLGNYFGTIDHSMLEQMLRQKIRDDRFMRYIIRMFKAGVLSKGELRVSEEGVPQGSICSPVLSNIFAHHVLDEWFEGVVKQHCKGQVALFRYCDDAVICCQYDSDADRIKRALAQRLAKFHLKLNEEKTRLVDISKPTGSQGAKGKTFDFLGFTFYWGKSRKRRYIPKLKSSGKRLSAKLQKVNVWARNIRNQLCLRDIWRVFCAKLRGHFQYYGVSFNTRYLNRFLMAATRILFKWLNRRSDCKSFNWTQFNHFIRSNPLPTPRIYHKLF